MKVKLTEGQVERLKSVIKEGVETRYNREINVSFNYYNLKFKGKEIDYISKSKMRLFFNIEIEGRNWGLKGIEINGIKGPDSIQVEVTYYDEQENPIDESYEIRLNWDLLAVTSERSGIITVGDEIEIDLGNDAEGNLVVTRMELPLYTL